MVTVEDLRATIGARADAGDGVVWPVALWERLWGRLTSVQRGVVYWHVFAGESHTAVAVRLGVSRGSVDAAWRRALARIRDALPDHFASAGFSAGFTSATR